MSRPYTVPLWKQAPFVRLLLPLIAGILLQWYGNISIVHILTAICLTGMAFVLFSWLPIARRFQLRRLQGLMIQLLFLGFGLLLTRQKDIRHRNNWFGNKYKAGTLLVVRVDEPPVEKNKSYKAEGVVEYVIGEGGPVSCSGKLLLYFSKDSAGVGTQGSGLQYGDRVIVRKPVQSIANSGNPGAFDYKRYTAFQGIFHQVFLKSADWTQIRDTNSYSVNRFWKFIYNTREYLLFLLQKNVAAGKDELGITQALLIGYTNDLDKDLVQAYSNTGVVHLIAISGMHLGLIYVFLVWFFARIPLIRRSGFLQLAFLLACLWMFAILTGASASVLRAAVMFSCIAIGKHINRRNSIYSSLTVSAFILLCCNPYFLWAVGFQLSYLAVLGIVIFQRPIYNCFYIKNKWAEKAWQLMSVSTAAQLLTFPVCLYYFHQFPNLFLITNLVAVPMAVIILYTAIGLVAFSWIPVLGVLLGKLVGVLTSILNSFILTVNDFPFAVWKNISVTGLTTWLLYALVAGFASWLIRKDKKYFKIGLASLFAFTLQTLWMSWQTTRQKKIIVYNVPQYQAIDFIEGDQFCFVGNEKLIREGNLKNFHLKPARIKYRVKPAGKLVTQLHHKKMFYQFNKKKILLLDRTIRFDGSPVKMEIDIIIFSKKTRNTITQMTEMFNCKLFVFDASNNSWQIEKWKDECRLLGLNYYVVAEQGAFVYNIST